MRVALRAALLAAGLLLAAAGAPAQEPEGWAYELANELMSPYCPGRTLADCPSPQAETLRMWLIVQEAAGRKREEVQVELVERFGEGILAAPRPQGFGLAAYLIPIAAFLAGGVLVAAFLLRQTRVRAAPTHEVPAGGPLDPELERRVDEDLAR
jgi:cytochrome c-type biogenesis protein CcmH/NrfF